MTKTKYPNRNALREANDIYLDTMRSFIIRLLKQVSGETAEDLIQDALMGEQQDMFWQKLDETNDIEAAIDFNYFPQIIRTNWNYGFADQFNNDLTVQSMLWLIRKGRNSCEHRGRKDLDTEFTRTHLFLIAEILGKINKPNEQHEVEAIHEELFSDDTAERLADAEERLKEMEAENAEYKKNLAAIEKHLETTKSEKSKYEKDNATLSKQVDEKEKRRKKLSKQLKSARTETDKYKKSLAGTKQRLEKSEAVQANYKEDLDATTKKLEEAKRKCRVSEDSLKATSDRLEDAVDEWMASVERLTVLQKLFTTAAIESQKVQAMFPPFETDAAVRILDRRGTDKRNYLVKLIEQKQPTLIYVQSETMVNNLLKLVGPEKEGVIGKHDERTSEAKETEILEKLENRELIAVVSNTTFSTLEPSHCVEHFVFCHLTPGLGEFFKRCQPAFASEKDTYLHLIYNSKQDVQYLDKWLDQKYPDKEVVKNLYRALEGFVGVNGPCVKPENLYSKLDIERLGITELGIETGLAIFEEVGALERNNDGIKLLPFSGRKSKIHHRGEELKDKIEEIRSFQLKQPIEKIWEEILGALDIDLEKYLLKSNVASAEVNAEIVLEEEETSFSEASLIDSEVNNPNDIDDKQLVTEQPGIPSKFSGKWTMERTRDSLSEEVRDYHEKNYPEERCNIFYRRVVEIQNLIEAEDWRLKPPKLNKESCSFQLMDKGITRIRIVFGILLDTFLPHANLVDRNGEKIPDLSIKSNPPRIFAPITEEEAKQLERQHGCEFWGITERKIYYNIPDDITELRPVLEFAYNKHRGQ